MSNSRTKIVGTFLKHDFVGKAFMIDKQFAQFAKFFLTANLQSAKKIFHYF